MIKSVVALFLFGLSPLAVATPGVVPGSSQIGECETCLKLSKLTTEFRAHASDETGDAELNLMFQVAHVVRDAKLASSEGLRKREIRAMIEAVLVVLPSDFDKATLVYLGSIRGKHEANFDEQLATFSSAQRSEILEGIEEAEAHLKSPRKKIFP